MTKFLKSKPWPKPYRRQFDLEMRTYNFALRCRNFIKKLPKNTSNFEYSKQLVRSSGSQAANYIEANEALSKKDFIHRIKICRKEVKESRLWLMLFELNIAEKDINEKNELIQETTELIKIYSAIIQRSQ